jgi:hypothetical protein
MSDAQETFYQVFSRLSHAMMARERARVMYDRDGMCPEYDEASIAYAAAVDEFLAFSREHAGQSFHVFRPEEIEAAIVKTPPSVASLYERSWEL